MLERKWLRLRYRLQQWAGRTPPRVAFLHIPKCGGTTIFRHFKANIGGGRSGRIAHFDSLDFARFDDAALSAMRRAQFVCGHFGWNALMAAGADALRVTILREPLARLASLYRYGRAKRQSAHFAPMLDAAKQRSFGDFCLSPETDVKALIDNAMTRALAHDYRPLGAWDRTRTLQAALTHLDQFDLVLDLENLDASLPRLAAITGTRTVRGQSRSNATPPISAKLMSRAEFESDAELAALIAQDCALYRQAAGLNRSGSAAEAQFAPMAPSWRAAAVVNARSPLERGAD